MDNNNRNSFKVTKKFVSTIDVKTNWKQRGMDPRTTTQTTVTTEKHHLTVKETEERRNNP